MSISLEQVRQAKPERCKGAPARTRSHYERILALLRERGDAGVNGSELYAAPHLFGRSPRNRISELRKDGHLIEGKPRGGNDWHYRLITADSADWYTRQTGRQRPQTPAPDFGPLFATSTASHA